MSLLLLFGGGAASGVNMSATTPTGIDGFMVVPNTVYSAHAQFKADSTVRQCTVAIHWYDEAGGDLGTPSTSASIVDSAVAWTTATVSDTSPPTAIYAAVVVEVENVDPAEVHYVDKIGFYLRVEDPTWDPGEPPSAVSVTLDDLSVFDAKGDLLAGTADDTADRLPIGLDGQVLTADSAETTGMKWETPSGGGGGADETLIWMGV